MKYSIHSSMMENVAKKSPRPIWRVMSWFLLPLEYLGALIAPAVVLAIPFQIFHAHHFSPAVFWSVTALIGAFVLVILYASLVSWLRSFRRRVIYVEPVIVFVSWIFAVAVVTWIFPPK